MKLAGPYSSRYQLTRRDIAYILQVLAHSLSHKKALLELMADPQSRDILLDDPQLVEGIVESKKNLPISTHLYFYILVRQAFLDSGIENRDTADYVASVLTEFSRIENMKNPLLDGKAQFIYSVDVMEQLSRVGPRRRFFLFVFSGNLYLTWTGVFKSHLERRELQRGAPGVRYYESMGRAAYRSARDHALAEEFQLREVYASLTEMFSETRRILNQLSKKLFHLG